MFKEITLETDVLICVILPELGGKVKSLYYKPKQFELAAQPSGHLYMKPGKNTPFAKCDASGLDDAFPTIDVCTVQEGNRTIQYTDHGEIWRSEFELIDQTRDVAVLEYLSTDYGYLYQKKMQLVCNQLHMSYQIKNIGKEAFPCLWTLHGFVKYEEGMRFIFPSGAESFLNAERASKELGQRGAIHKVTESMYDFTRVPTRKNVCCQKYYINGKVQEGFCGYEYPSQQVRCEYRYDKEKLPYLGLWITSGGFRGDYNCALEPSNGFYDSVAIAQANDACPVLEPEEGLDFTITISFCEMEQI